MPASDMCSVRGIGVADSESTSTATRSDLNLSFCSTPKRCSSSITTRPRLWNSTSRCSRRWVPTTMSTTPLRKPVERVRDVSVAAEARQLAHRDREWGEPLRERQEVLLCENGGGHQHGHLAPLAGGLEGCAKRELGLAEPDVAADHAVHRTRCLHVTLDLVEHHLLVGGLLVGERRLQLALPGAVRSERVSVGHLAARVQRQELARHLLGAFLDTPLHPLPFAAAEPATGAGGSRRHRRSGQRGRGGRPARTACPPSAYSMVMYSCSPSASLTVRISRKRPMPWSRCTTTSPGRTASRRPLRGVARGGAARAPRDDVDLARRAPRASGEPRRFTAPKSSWSV